MSRTLNVVRMQLVNKQTYIWVPLIVLAGAFILTLAIWAVIRNAGADGPLYGGGSQAPLWYFGVVGVQALTLTFPFSQAMSVTRREFFLGTMLTAALTSALLAAIFVAGGFIERATGGWGMEGYFFSFDFVGEWTGGLIYLVLALLIFVVGFWAATLYKRFGGVWLTVVLSAIALILVALLWVAGRLNAWAQIGAWLATQGPVGLSLWGLLVATALAVIAFFTLRRAVP